MHSPFLFATVVRKHTNTYLEFESMFQVWGMVSISPKVMCDCELERPQLKVT